MLECHDMTTQRKTGENLYKLMREAILELRKRGIDVVGLAGDAGPDTKKARRLSVEEFPSLFAADCWPHQV